MTNDNNELARLSLEHEAWAKAHKAKWLDAHPNPVGAWDGNSWYRQIQENTLRWIREIKPLANAWWSERGYDLKWTDKGATPVKKD